MGLMEYHTIYARTAKPTYAQQKYCQECCQKLDWSENDE